MAAGYTGDDRTGDVLPDRRAARLGHRNRNGPPAHSRIVSGSRLGSARGAYLQSPPVHVFTATAPSAVTCVQPPPVHEKLQSALSLHSSSHPPPSQVALHSLCSSQEWSQSPLGQV